MLKDKNENYVEYVLKIFFIPILSEMSRLKIFIHQLSFNILMTFFEALNRLQ